MLDEAKLSTIFLLHLFAYSVSEAQLYISILLEQELRPKVKQASTTCAFYAHKNITSN